MNFAWKMRVGNIWDCICGNIAEHGEFEAIKNSNCDDPSSAQLPSSNSAATSQTMSAQSMNKTASTDYGQQVPSHSRKRVFSQRYWEFSRSGKVRKVLPAASDSPMEIWNFESLSWRETSMLFMRRGHSAFSELPSRTVGTTLRRRVTVPKVWQDNFGWSKFRNRTYTRGFLRSKCSGRLVLYLEISILLTTHNKLFLCRIVHTFFFE